MQDPKRKFDIDYAKILSRKMQSVPSWRDMAQACNEILGQEVDARRRKLEKIRDSVKYRRGDVLSNVIYQPNTDKLAISEVTKQVIDIPVGYKITKASVRNVIRNIAYYNHPDSTDFLDLSFEYNDETCRWLKPVNITQERDALLKNSYIMGFDFFNTKLNDEDLQRMYEYVQLYWEESGSSNNFINFIGFIKNIRFDLVALWTEDTVDAPSDDPNSEYPYLEPYNDSMVSVKNGGKHWLTSHTEIQYDLAQFDEFYIVNLDDLEELFYYFAPIILVLERVTGTLNVETPVYGINSPSATVFEYGLWKPVQDFITSILGISSFSTTVYSYGILDKLSGINIGNAYGPIDLSTDKGKRDYAPALIATGV
jgi:hypothetical protein